MPKGQTFGGLACQNQKGKGYEFAEEDNTGIWHGVGPFDLASGVVKGDPNQKCTAR